MLKPLIVVAPAVLNWLTSGRTRRITWLASMIVGVNWSLTPNSLNTTVIVASPFVLDDEATGIGNSPPALLVRPGAPRLVGEPPADLQPGVHREPIMSAAALATA